MEQRNKFDIIKEFFWNILVYGLYYVYCLVMLLLFHLITYSIFDLNWSMNMIFIFALIGSTVMMAIRIGRLISKRKL